MPSIQKGDVYLVDAGADEANSISGTKTEVEITAANERPSIIDRDFGACVEADTEPRAEWKRFVGSGKARLVVDFSGGSSPSVKTRAIPASCKFFCMDWVR